MEGTLPEDRKLPVISKAAPYPILPNGEGAVKSEQALQEREVFGFVERSDG
jgi:hypothetical protein